MSKKTVLITGCSTGGIGWALAKQFQKRGLTVFATARDLSKMADLESLPNVVLISLDVTSQSDIAAAVQLVKTQAGGKLDYLVNNSGQSRHWPILDHNLEEAKDLFEVNFWGVLRMIQAFAPLLIEAMGTVVNIGSINAHVNLPFCAIYNASKAAVHSLDDTLRMEFKPLNVKVLTVIAGTVETNINTNSPRTELPSTSLYLPTEEYLNKMHDGQAHPSRMKPHVFAEQVVSDVLGGMTGKTWRGAYVTTSRWLGPVLPNFVKDHILTNETNLDKVGLQ